MKSNDLMRAIGGIDDDLIEGAEKQQSERHTRISWVKWGSIAAALALAVALGAIMLPGVLKSNQPAVTPDTPSAGNVENPSGNQTGNQNGGEIVQPAGAEWAPRTRYKYAVDEGKYAGYQMGRVIHERYVGEKLSDVTVTAGWMYKNGGEYWWNDEHARAEIYEISGVSDDTAVAIRFLDELEAELTTCYYVILNPDADLTPVQEYIIDHTADNDKLYDGAE